MRTGMCSLVLVLAFAIPSPAQQTAPTAPATTPITIGPVNCAYADAPLNCYSVAMTIGGNSGTAWIATSFILFRPGLEGSNYVEGLVTSTTVTHRNAIGQATQEIITFTISNPSANGSPADPDADGDSDVVQGSLTINFSYGPPGRWGRYPTVTITGSGAQSITTD